jgi:glycosyltransferase involved in cell wall biosynthesis
VVVASAGADVKVLHVTDSYLPVLGGIELHVRDLATRQQALGHDVSVATLTPDPAHPSSGTVRRVDRTRRSWLDDEAPDTVHAHVSIVSPFALATARAAAGRGMPTVVTVHSIWTGVGPLPTVVRDLWGMRRWGVTWTAVSEPAAARVRDLLGTAVQVVPNAVDLAAWSAFGELPEGRPPHVLSVMRLTRVKRSLPLARILGAAAADADLTATIVGDGPERPAVQRYLRRHGLSDRVQLTGALTREQIRELLRRTSVFVAPAHRESFGIAALEARASGVPVVASARSGVASFVEHGREGLLAKDDRELAEQLVTLLQDRALRERMARHNRLVPPAYGWDEALVRNHAMYELAAARRRLSGGPALEGVLVG